MNEIITTQAKTPAEMALKLMKLKELKAEIDSQLKEINAKLLEEMSALGVLTLKTDQMTISRASRTTTKVVNLEEAQMYFKINGLQFATVQTPDDVTMNTIKLMVKDGKTPTGVETKETEYVSVRLAK
jgi:hypothetical protein